MQLKKNTLNHVHSKLRCSNVSKPALCPSFHLHGFELDLDQQKEYVNYAITLGVTGHSLT